MHARFGSDFPNARHAYANGYEYEVRRKNSNARAPLMN
jgi:hypothetical protein